ncbi:MULTISPECIES: response regulator transcription factor [Paracoccus]|jgi:two-component system response regulator RegA|uniref:Response regulator n=2 Tax=Paracoccus TaxID=265 RepID=A0A5C4RAQ0_9RHOB|nr:MULTISPECIES: response regulator [Paracoccus]MBF5077854.1 response regulator [Paracoccus sp. NBH48]TNH40982.1 response regulator [Paracoccus haeundaensis]
MTRRLLIVEDDAALAATLTESFARRGYDVRHASSTDEGIALAQQSPPDLALVDLKLPGRSGLECVQALAGMDPAPRIVVLTGFASIATAVEAIKLGAAHYLAKPATTSEIEAAFAREAGDPSVEVTARRTSLRTQEWETIQSTLRDCDFNISEAARRMGMHRRTLARKLAKRQIG